MNEIEKLTTKIEIVKATDKAQRQMTKSYTKSLGKLTILKVKLLNKVEESDE